MEASFLVTTTFNFKFQAVQDAGQKLMDVANIGVPEIEQRLKALNQAWGELKQMSGNRGDKLNQSLTFQQFLAKVEEEEGKRLKWTYNKIIRKL